jgi:5-methyltetrahydrofolate--homocysteine methyltransferase
VRIELAALTGEAPTLADVKIRGYQGCRYSFGYPACPELSDNKQIFDLLRPEEFGITLDTDTYQMHPQESTTALITTHPEAKYFAI